MRLRRLPSVSRGCAAAALAAMSLLFQQRHALAQGDADGPSLKIQVKGSVRIQAIATRDAQSFVVRGAVSDDAGVPITTAAVTIQASAAGSGRLPEELPHASLCDRRLHGFRVNRAPNKTEYLVDTDEQGEFCLRGDARLESPALLLRVPGSKFFDGAEMKISFENDEIRSARALLRFEPAVDAIDLDRESVPVTASLRIERGEPFGNTQSAKREGLTIFLDDEKDNNVARATTGGDGKARFDVKTASLEGPGAGELRLRFEGSPELARATASTPIVRRAEVKLALERAIGSADPEDGAPIFLDVTSIRGPVSSGVVEALRGSDSVGTGAVDAGKARVIVSFPAERKGSVPLTLRYVSSAPWWMPGPDLRVELPIAGPGIARQILLATLVFAVTAWVLASWRRAPKPARPKDAESVPAPPSGRAGVQVIATTSGQADWRGTVTDAHEGKPIAGASLSIVIPSFEGSGIAARATTDEAGMFTLKPESGAVPSGARLLVESPAYSTYEQPLPPPSVLSVAIVTRRRALLERLVKWARRHGAPFDGPPEPTPGHVRRAAARANASEIESWAQQIERCAFGPDDIDEQAEQSAKNAEPKAGLR